MLLWGVVLCVSMFARSAYCAATAEALLQERWTQLKQEQMRIEKRMHTLIPLNQKLMRAAEDTRQCHLVFADFSFADNESAGVVLDIYRKFHSKQQLVIKQYTWPGHPLYVVNGVVVSMADVASEKDVVQALKGAWPQSDWIDIVCDQDRQGLVLIFHEDVKVNLSPSLEDLHRLKHIEWDLQNVNKRMVAQAQQDKTAEIQQRVESEQPDLKWGHVFLGPVTESYMQDLQLEMDQADHTPYKAAQLPWYLQLLKNLKESGYLFPDERLEEALFQRVLALLPQGWDKGKLYHLLSYSDGIQRVLLGRSPQGQHFSQTEFDQFMAKLQGYFLVREEGERVREKNFYVRYQQFDFLIRFLRTEPAKYHYFAIEPFIVGKEPFEQLVREIYQSSLRLQERKSFAEPVRERYRELALALKPLVKGLEAGAKEVVIVDEFLENFHRWADTDKLVSFLNFFILQDVVFYNTRPLSLAVWENKKIDVGSEDYQELAQALDAFVTDCPIDFFKYAGLGQAYPSMLTMPWTSWLSGMEYAVDGTFPVAVQSRSDGRSILVLRDDLLRDMLRDCSLKNGLQQLGVRLWVKAFVSAALLRSAGLKDAQVSMVLLQQWGYALSQEERKAMFAYLRDGQFHRVINVANKNMIDGSFLIKNSIFNMQLQVDEYLLRSHMSRLMGLVLEAFDKMAQASRSHDLLLSS